MLRSNPKNKPASDGEEEKKTGFQKSYGQRQEAPLRKAQLPRRLPDGFETAIPPKTEEKP